MGHERVHPVWVRLQHRVMAMTIHSADFRTEALLSVVDKCYTQHKSLFEGGFYPLYKGKNQYILSLTNRTNDVVLYLTKPCLHL